MSDCIVCDAVNADDKQLRLKWKMDNVTDYRSIAELGNLSLQVDPLAESDTGYTAELYCGDGLLLSADGFQTRLDAQVGAEGLLKQMKEVFDAAMKGKSRMPKKAQSMGRGAGNKEGRW